MIILEGKNLCERQKELNYKVNEAANNKVDFQDIKAAQEHSDVDRLFKIDLASKYRNTDYLIEQLKCGDSLFISRALKCEWIYGKEYAHIINPDYLHHNIFPSMSIKMKKKTLTAVSLHVRDDTRAQNFFEYCINMKMNKYAYKFLIFTSELYKQQFLNKIDLDFFPIENYKHLIGNSWILADIYCSKGGDVTKLSYLYSVNAVMYLDLSEKYNNNGHYYYYNGPTLTSKIARSILKNHKSRILNNPLPYLRIIKKEVLLKFSSSDDAKVYAAALLPDDVKNFWGLDYYKLNKHIVDLIKTDNLYLFMKQIFSNKYPKEEFEMTKQFYQNKYYTFMTITERENWALLHLDKKLGVIPEDDDYKWYEFVNFPLGFREIKKKIQITTNENKRSQMLVTLTKSAKTHKEVEELLTYYYNRHVNEKKHLTQTFLDRVIEQHNVLSFDEVSWSALDKLFQSLDIYSSGFRQIEYCVYTLIYHVINEKTLPNGLSNNLDQVCNYIATVKYYKVQFSAEQQKIVYEYVVQYLTEKLKGFESLDYNEEVRNKVHPYLKTLIKLKEKFEQRKEYPEIAIKYMNLDMRNFHYIVNPRPKLETPKDIKEITAGFLFRCLKQNPTHILDKFSLMEIRSVYPYYLKLPGLRNIWQKMRVYFSDDIAKKYVDLCLTSLFNLSPEMNDDNNKIESRIISAHVFAIFQLADEQTKVEFMDKHAPASGKIEYDKIKRYLLETQTAICHLHYYSRPPVPLAKTALYLKGSYVSKCKDMFNSYLVNLSPTLRAEFIYFLLDSPVSIQQRGLRLAFQSFEGKELKDIICNVWKKTKNVSLRKSIYKLIVDKICNRFKEKETELFELLIELTTLLHQDDDDEIFQCFERRSVPSYALGMLLQTTWKTVSVFPDKKSNIKRKIRIVNNMKSSLGVMDEDFVETLVNDHIFKILIEQKLRPEVNADILLLNEELWDLVATYIVYIPSESKQEKSLNVLKLILRECFNHWRVTHNAEDYVFQLFFKEFLNKLQRNANYFSSICFSRVTHIFQYLLGAFEEKFGVREMYSYYWDWTLSLLTRTATNGCYNCDKDVYISFGSELGLFVKKLKERNCYYNSFGDKIFGKIASETQSLMCWKKSTLTDNDVKVLIAFGLAQHPTLETLALSLNILPQNISTFSDSNYESELKEIIQIIKNQNSDELVALLNDKYVDSDSKVRKILL